VRAREKGVHVAGSDALLSPPEIIGFKNLKPYDRRILFFCNFALVK
jgi:hypothetical protein